MSATTTPARKVRKVTPADVKAIDDAAREAEVLNGVRAGTDKTGPAKAPVRTATPKADAKPAPEPKKEKTLQEKILRPASATVNAYVAWLKASLGDAEFAKLAKDPERFAAVAMQNYGLWQSVKRG